MRLRRRAFAKIDVAVGPEVRSAQVVEAARHCVGFNPFFAAIGPAVVIGVGQLPNDRRGRATSRTVSNREWSKFLHWYFVTVHNKNDQLGGCTFSRE
jgi:hypothetical protein